jgi:hypothetical protein
MSDGTRNTQDGKREQTRGSRRGTTHKAPHKVDREAILTALRNGESHESAARRGGCRLDRFYAERKAEPAWAAQLEEAQLEGRRRRANALAHVLYQGAEKAGEDPRYSAQLFFALTNLDSANWQHVNHVQQQLRAEVTHDVDATLADILADIACLPPAGGDPHRRQIECTSTPAGAEGGGE